VKRTLFLTTVLILAAAAGPASASTSRFSLAIQGGFAGQEENNLGPALQGGAGFGFSLGRGFSVTGEAAFWKSRSRTSFRKLYEGTLTVLPVLVSLRYEFRPNAYFIPYALAGGSYVFARYRLGHPEALPWVRVEQRVEAGPAFHLGLGVRVPLTWKASFFGEALYIIRSAPAETKLWGADEVFKRDDIRVNLHTVLVKFGVRFFL